MSYNPTILNDILNARSLSRRELSRRLNIREEDLQRELTRQPEPKQALLNDIAKELALPAFVFFMAKPPRLHDIIPDFRSKNPAPSAKSRETIESIQLAEGVQRAAIDGLAVGVQVLPAFKTTRNEEIDAFALAAREYFGITAEDQLGSPPNEWFALLATAGKAVTGVDVRTLESASHKCHRAALKDKSELADLDIPNAKIECQAFTRDGGGVNIHIWMNDHEARKGIEEH